MASEGKWQPSLANCWRTFFHVLPNFEEWQVIYQTVGDALKAL
jgi:hypothetical protein